MSLIHQYLELVMLEYKPLIEQAIRKLPWVHGLKGDTVPDQTRRGNEVSVELVPSSAHAAAMHHPGVGIDRWEIWLPPDWKSRVYDNGLAVFPEFELLVLDAKPAVFYTPDVDWRAFDGVWQLTGARPRYTHGGGVNVEVDSVFFGAALAGHAGAGKTCLEAMSKAVMAVERHLGNRK